MTRMMRLSLGLMVSFAGGTYPMPGMLNGPFIFPSGLTMNAVVHMQEVSTVFTVMSSFVGLVTVNSLVTFRFFIEIVPKSWKISGAVKALFASLAAPEAP